jgi:hypothetical protein
MVLSFKEKFDDGTPTLVFDKIIAGVVDVGFIKEDIKIHAIKEGQRWRAGLSIQMALGGKPKEYKHFNKDIKQLSVCVSVQSITMDYHHQIDCLQVYIDGRKLGSKETVKLIHNDGLTRDQFIKFIFFGRTSFTGQIIHWTDFKY